MFRKSNQAITTLTEKLDSISSKINKITKEITITNETSITYWSSKRREINKLYTEAKLVYDGWAKLNIPYTYRENIRRQIKHIKSLKIQVNKVDYRKFVNGNVTRQSINNVITQSLSNYFIALDSGQRKYNLLLTSTQAINKQIKNLESVGDFNVNKSSLAKLKTQQKVLLDKIVEQKYITIIDKNGKPINYQLATYAELTARVANIQSITAGTLDLASEYDSDLIQVSAHNTETAYDAQFEGKVFSLSGRDSRFPPAIDLPPFHPNCLHTISVYFAEAQKPKTLKDISDFSLGKTETHPTVKSHKPISERKF